MIDPNTPIDLNISAGALKRMIEDAWHDSAQETAIRFQASVDSRNQIISEATGNKPAYVGIWTHIFTEEGKEVEHPCSLAINIDTFEIIAMIVHRGHKDHDASADEIKDVAESLAANDVKKSPENWEFFETDKLSAWACDQIVERRSGSI